MLNLSFVGAVPSIQLFPGQHPVILFALAGTGSPASSLRRTSVNCQPVMMFIAVTPLGAKLMVMCLTVHPLFRRNCLFYFR